MCVSFLFLVYSYPATMRSLSISLRPVPKVLFLLLHNLLLQSVTLTSPAAAAQVPALFVFGDSTVDAGNNNYIKTPTKSDFPPYGKDFPPDHVATGRFCNGRLVTDFVASYIGLRGYVPAYLDPRVNPDDLQMGACFASASSGFDPLTSHLASVISVEKQLQYFMNYRSRMEGYIGKDKTDSLIRRAIFVVSAGTNDFVINYYGPTPIRRQTSSIAAYQQFVLHLVHQFVQELLEMGAGNIAVVGLPPMGCLPAVITFNSLITPHRGCIESMSSVARAYNTLLQSKLATLSIATGARILYIDIYKPLDDMIKRPQQFGFENVECGCCGSGLVEASFLCNSLSEMCSNDSKYLFWDAIHPTEAAYYNIFRSVRPIIDRLLRKK